MTNTPHQTASGLATWAEVRAHDHVMRYRRSGTGPVVLVLDPVTEPSGSDGSANSALPYSYDPRTRDLLERLSAGFRVVAPSLPSQGNISLWLSEFLEGLGTCSVSVIASGWLCVPALELAVREADRVKRLVLIPDGEADESATAATMVTSLGGTGTPLLIVRPGTASDASGPVIAQFLAPSSTSDSAQVVEAGIEVG